MKKEIEEVLLRCPWCIKVHPNRTIPRPFGTALHAQHVGECVHSDFYLVTKDPRAEYNYILAFKDDRSRFLYLLPTREATAEATALGLIQYMSYFSKRPINWVSDGGSHYKNTTMKLLAQLSGAKHRITTAYQPQGNGTIESCFRGVGQQLILILERTRLEIHEWHKLVPQIMFQLNNSSLERLEGMTPNEVFLGAEPLSPLSHIFDHTLGKDREPIPGILRTSSIKDEVEELRKRIETAQNRIKERAKATSPTKARLPQFTLGDYVVKAAIGRDAANKLKARWIGPMKVIDTVNDHVFRVQGLLADDPTYEIHSSRLAYFAPEGTNLGKAVLDMLAHDDGGHTVKAIVDHRDNGDGLELKVRWLGFESTDIAACTWEPAESVIESARSAVAKYHKALNKDDEHMEAFKRLLEDRRYLPSRR